MEYCTTSHFHSVRNLEKHITYRVYPPGIMLAFIPIYTVQDHLMKEKCIFPVKNCDSKNIWIDPESILASYFTKEEFSQLHQFPVHKRKIEWLCGRLAVKFIIKQLYGISYKRTKIGYKNTGAPFISRFPRIPISISHSNEYAVGAVSYTNHQNIGIDIEKIDGEHSPEFLSIAFSKRERKYLAKKSYTQVFINWTIKEAFLKVLENGFHECLHNIEIIDNMIIYNADHTNNISIYTNTFGSNYLFSVIHKNG